jgi:hypothetical protein
MKPIVSREVFSPHCNSRGGVAIDHIVLHYTTSRNIDGTISHFMNGTPKVSAHYVIGQDGELVQMVPDDKAAWHATVMNVRSIGIEHAAKAGDKITPAQEKTSIALIKWLVETYNIPRENIIPHVAVKSTSCPGDLFGAFGGKLGASKEVQIAAVNKWLTDRVFSDAIEVLEPEFDMSDDNTSIDNIPAQPAPVVKKPASQSLTVWGAVLALVSAAGPAVSTYFGVQLTPELVTAVGATIGALQSILGRIGATQPIKFK